MTDIAYVREDAEDCVRQYLSFLPPKALSRIVNSIKKPKSKLLSFLSGTMYDAQEKTYLPLTSTPWIPGYNHEQTFEQFIKGTPLAKVGGQGIQYFANTLEVPKKDGDGRYVPPPSQRIINCGVYVHTFEIDPSENFQDALAEQILWAVGGNKDTDCIIGKIYQELCQFCDFRGIEFIWSGSKSCHMHIAFDGRHLAPRLFGILDDIDIECDLPDVPNKYLRDGYQAAWDELSYILQAYGIMFDADDELKRPEQWRRLPWGIRKHEKDSPIGIPAGTAVPQAVLWSKFRRNARGRTDWFHKPSKFFEVERRPAAKKPKSRTLKCDLTEDQQNRFLSDLSILCNRMWGDPAYHPWPAKVGSREDGYIIHFFNDEQDQNPASYMAGDHDRLVLQGTIRGNTQDYLLPTSVNELVENFLINDRLIMDDGEQERPRWAERQFDKVVNNPQDVRDHLGKYALFAARSQTSCIFGGEGAGKTTSIMKAITQYDEPHEGHIIIACQSYDQAEQKCREFNELNDDDDYQGIFLYSLSQYVTDACEALGIKKPTSATIAESGFSNMLDHIYSEGGALVDYLEDRKKDLWDSLRIDETRKKRPVWFTVHSVVQKWHLHGGTRLWLHHEFANEYAKGKKDRDTTRLYNAMAAQWIIHDEVRMSDLMVQYPAHEVERVRKLGDDYLKNSNRTRLNICRQAGFKDTDFDYIREIAECQFTDDDIFTVDSDCEAFGVKTAISPYETVKGNTHYAKIKNWWNENPARITFLTTEHRIANAMDHMEYGPVVFNFDRPEFFGEEETTVDLILDKNARKADVKKLVKEIKNQHPNGLVISNMTDGLASTHDKAKGSNNFNQGNVDCVTSVFTMLAPQQYEQLLVENALFDTENMVQLYYLDLFNQACGRTLGYRHQSNIKTQAVMSKRLWKEVAFTIYANSRYRIKLKNS
jgi:hypothetical protein